MTQVRRIIQLKAEGLSKLKISQSLHIHRATLDNYLLKLLASENSFPELLEFSDDQLTALVYSDPVTPRADSRIDELRKHLDYFKAELTRPGVTRKILWEEYYQAYPEGYRYAQFCEHFARHVKITKGSRQERFLENEKSLLKPLPQEMFAIKHTTVGKVQMNYHIILGEDKHQYSVTHRYVGQTTKIIYDEHNVEIYIGFQRIALHKRDYRKHGYTTLPEHMPEKHLKYNETLGWDADYFISIASKIGDSTAMVFKKVLASKDFIEQTYKACIGLKRLSEIYGPTRFDAACRRALKGSRITYGMIKNILENNLDKQAEPEPTLYFLPGHENIRGPQNYN